jgi:methyl-accepting chemotaxis protein
MESSPPPAPAWRPARSGLRIRVLVALGILLALEVAEALLTLRDQSGQAFAAAFALRLLALAWIVASGGWLLRNVMRPLERATAVMDRMSAGDLSAEITLEQSGQLRSLVAALLRMREHMVGVVGHIRTGMVNVASHAVQINRDNAALSERTGTQAASVQETAGSTEQLTAAVRHNADTAQRAHGLARSASERAEQGGAQMRDVVATMEAIRASSRDIREIIGVIDGIAFQTNILALNAAVEAARAGEQGRGFAVVASEVRSLAQRCAEAARQIRGLIGASAEGVEQGGARVADAGRAVDEIVAVVREMAELLGHIDLSTREQSRGLEIINDAISRTDGATRENAAFVRGAARTAKALQDRAAMVYQAVDQFRLGAREHAGETDAVQLVQSGCEFLRAQGRDAFLAEVNKLDAGRFIFRDLYLMALDMRDVMFVAHGHLPSRLGTGADVKDVDGKYFPREMVRMARDAGEGWVDYKWVHPVTGAVMQKSGYVRREGELAVYAGIYKG